MAIVINSFTFTGGTQTFIVPPFVTIMTVKVWGAGGGTRFTAGGFGGPGGYSQGNLQVTNGDVLTIITGQGGSVSTSSTFGGGGGGGTDTFAGIIGGSGGGRSALIKNGTEVITAAGGGGGGSSTSSPAFSNGGSGGGAVGTNAFVNASGATGGGGFGGTQSAGGAGGVNPAGAASNGLPGSSLKGGQGGPSGAGNSGGGGGGGGGFFGGGGGMGQLNTLGGGFQDLAGGGGSSFIGGVTEASTLSTPQNTSTSNTSVNLRPPNQSDGSYIAGVGLGASSSNGGNGLVVLQYDRTTLLINKQVDKAITEINSTLTYTIVLNNTNALTIGNVRFIDTIPNGTTFVPGSVSINGATIPNSPNPPGFNIGTLFAGNNTITFKVDVLNALPSPNPIPNTSTVSATGGFVLNSNTVTTTVNAPVITSLKTVDKTFAQVSDVLNYTIAITNSGTVTATNVIFVDTIPSGTSLVPSSFTQDGSQVSGSPNPPGVAINNLLPGSTTTIMFKVLVNTIPNPNPISNTSTVGSSGLFVINSNSVSTTVNMAIISSAKVVNKAFANVGDILTYTIAVTNSGNTTATNLVFLDTIPNGTSLLAGSLNQDGNLVSGTPNTPGVTLPNSLKALGVTTVSFKVTVNTIPNPNPIPNSASISSSFLIDGTTTPNRNGAASANTNTVNTLVNNASLSNITKLVDKSVANCGDIITYTIIIPNSGNVTAQNIIFKDTIPNGTILVPNSVVVNNVAISGANPSSGVTIPNIAPGTTATLTFSAQVTCL